MMKKISLYLIFLSIFMLNLGLVSAVECLTNDDCPLPQNECRTSICQDYSCVEVPLDSGICTDDGNACTDDVCSNGQCTHPAVEDGIDCSGGFCLSGQCFGSECDYEDMPEAPECQKAQCSLGVWTVVPDNGASCTDDGNACTDDVCQAGECTHPSVEDGTDCPDGYCDMGVCILDPHDCNDNNKCTTDYWVGAPVQQCFHTPVDCDDGKVYTIEICEPEIGCMYECVSDLDGDDICDEEDNCVDTFNPEQTDSDGDGKGDACSSESEIPEFGVLGAAFALVGAGYVAYRRRT